MYIYFNISIKILTVFLYLAIPKLKIDLNHLVNGMLTERWLNGRDMPVTFQVIERQFHPVFFLTFFLA